MLPSLAEAPNFIQVSPICNLDCKICHETFEAKIQFRLKLNKAQNAKKCFIN